MTTQIGSILGGSLEYRYKLEKRLLEEFTQIRKEMKEMESRMNQTFSTLIAEAFEEFGKSTGAVDSQEKKPVVLKGLLAGIQEQTDRLVKQRIKEHKKVCEKVDFPHFAPSDGICCSCRKQIYNVLDGKKPITGCPYCYRSYCE